jgi:5-methylcytosine-specific restriction enzyme subunit McrC
VVLRPDITWQVGGAVQAVVDAKYKAEKPSGYPNADLYQLLAYCTLTESCEMLRAIAIHMSGHEG